MKNLIINGFSLRDINFTNLNNLIDGLIEEYAEQTLREIFHFLHNITTLTKQERNTIEIKLMKHFNID